MPQNIRGNGLFSIEEALTTLVEDSERLDRERARFSDPPPSYTSQMSFNSTRSQSPGVADEEQRQREERYYQLQEERAASLPYYQLGAQVQQEQERIIKADESRSCPVPVGTNSYELAYTKVKNNWLQQGIWNSKWNSTAIGRWKHEEPPEMSSESEAESDGAKKTSLFSHNARRHPRPLKSEEGKKRAAERRARRECEREASRPVHQFFYQVSKEREEIQGKSRVGETAATVPTDINTMAYENVKKVWMNRGIWNTRWGTLPGMSWKHEEKLFTGTNLAESASAQPVHSENDPRNADVVPSLFERQVSSETIHHHASHSDTSQQETHELGPSGLDGQDLREFVSQSASIRRKGRKCGVHFATRQERQETIQSQATPSAYGPPFHPSKVSKPRRTGWLGAKRPSSATEQSLSDLKPLVGRNIHMTKTQAQGVRRSKRLHEMTEKKRNKVNSLASGSLVHPQRVSKRKRPGEKSQ